MKKRLIFALSVMLCVFILLTGCSVGSPDKNDEPKKENTDTDVETDGVMDNVVPVETTDETAGEVEPMETDEESESVSQETEDEDSGIELPDDEFETNNGGGGDPVTEPEDEEENSPDDFVIPECETYWYFDYLGGEGKLARVSHVDGKIYLVEKYPLCFYDDVDILYGFPTSDDPYIFGNDVFGTVSDKYFFKYNGDELESVTVFSSSSDHYGKQIFEKNYVMKYEKYDFTNAYAVSFYKNDVRMCRSETIEIDRLGDGITLRSIIADLNSGYRVDVEYDSEGRPIHISDNTFPSSSYRIQYDEIGNVASAVKYNNEVLAEEYFFTFTDGVLCDVEYKNYDRYGAGQYKASLRYDSDGRFTGAAVASEYYEGNVVISYDSEGRVTEYQMPDFAQGGYVIMRSFTYAENGLYSSVRTQVLRWGGGEVVMENPYFDIDVTMTYDSNGKITSITYPESVISPNVEMETTTFTYTSDGRLASDGAFDYTYDAKGNLVRKTNKDGKGYVEYYSHGMVKEHKYVRRGYDNDGNLIDYTIIDYYEPSDIYYVVGEATSSYGSSYAERSVSVAEDGTRYETTRTFDDLHVMTGYNTVIYDANGNEITQ